MADSAGHPPDPSNFEKGYIRAMSRPEVVKGYADWETLSEAEELCINRYVAQGARVLDLGCGTGRALCSVGKRIGSYLGVDSSPEMITAARKAHPWADFLNVDMLAPGLTLGDFDVVLALHNVVDLLHPVERRSRFLAVARRALTPGGFLIFSSHLTARGQASGYFEEDYHGASVTNFRSSILELTAEVEAAGFDVDLVMRDYRDGRADWAYAVGRNAAG